MNKTYLIGFLGADSEAKQILDKTMYKLNVAVSDNYKDKNGQWVNRTNWLTVVSFKDLSDFKKGDKIFIEGSINVREWTDKAGNKQKSFEINASNIYKLLKNEDSKEVKSADPFDDDLPF